MKWEEKLQHEKAGKGKGGIKGKEWTRKYNKNVKKKGEQKTQGKEDMMLMVPRPKEKIRKKPKERERRHERKRMGMKI